MIEDRAHSGAFEDLAGELLSVGLAFQFHASGRSMWPTVRDGDILQVAPVSPEQIRRWDIVLFRCDEGFKAHRVVRRCKKRFITRGDASLEADMVIQGEQIMGRVIAKECVETGRMVPLEGPVPRTRFCLSRLKQAVYGQIPAWYRVLFLTIVCLIALVFPSAICAQLGGVALDSVNDAQFVTSTLNCVGNNPATCTLTFNHTTGSAASSGGLLVVGISLNIKNNTPDSAVTSCTYNGTAMTSAANANPGNNLRVQIFYLKNPVSGTNQIKLTVNKTGGTGNPIGLEVGAISMYRVNTSFTSLNFVQNNGTSTTPTAAFTASTGIPGTNDGVLDVLAITSGSPPPTITANTSTTAPLVFENQQWINNSGTSGQDVEGSGSSAGGTGSALTMKETLGASVAWTIAAIDIPASNPTAAKINGFSAASTPSGSLLSWDTGGEMHNLGFNVYRDVGGEKVRVNPSLIAGSALLMHETAEQHAAKTYAWIDRSSWNGLYWLEDVDLNGTRTMHGPVTVQAGAAAIPQLKSAAMIGNARSMASISQGLPRVREAFATSRLTSASQAIGFQLAAQRAVKIFADHEGWYRITQPQLVAAGLGPNIEARSLHLYAEGVEQAIRITGATGVFGPQAAIEFYGTAIDTPYTGQRTYWLVSQDGPGMRIRNSAAGSAGPTTQSFMQTIEWKPRTTYFAALLQQDTDNFFGPLISPVPENQTLNLTNIAAGQGSLTVSLQGVTTGQQHVVTVMLNGATLGQLSFADQARGKASFPVPSGILTEGTNTLSLTSQLGDNDLSIVDYVDLSFPHTFTAESDFLKFTGGSGFTAHVTGFTHAPTRLIDVTVPARPMEVRYRTTIQNGLYTMTATIPWSSSGVHTLLAVSDAAFSQPANVALHQPSNLHSAQAGAEVVMLSAPQFMSPLQPLAALRRSEGHTVSLVNVDDVYDEFNFGERSPFAIRSFLHTAATAWANKPSYLLLGGDASVDPRNYLGFGFLDFMPTRVVVTSELKTASDDWFSDFNNTGFATIATGRLPARTVSDAQTIVGKILGYGADSTGGWTDQSMMVADVDDSSVNFTQAAQSIQKMIPPTVNVTDIFTTALGPSAAQQQVLAGINSGQLVVNYNGHGSVQVWGSGLMNDTLAASLTNGSKLPLFVAMNCLNGFFHDVYTQSLAEALMLAPNGGAVSVWASSGLTSPGPQFQMDQIFMRTVFSQPSTTIGDAVLAAKAGITDPDVRKTFILFGDPLMRLKLSQSSVASRVVGPVTQPDRQSGPMLHQVENRF